MSTCVCTSAQVDAGLSPAALAIAFCESRPFMASTIVGATSLAQLNENLAGLRASRKEPPWPADRKAESRPGLAFGQTGPSRPSRPLFSSTDRIRRRVDGRPRGDCVNDILARYPDPWRMLVRDGG